MNNLLIKDGCFITTRSVEFMNCEFNFLKRKPIPVDYSCDYFITYEFWFNDIQNSVSEYIRLYKRNRYTGHVGLCHTFIEKKDNCFYVNIEYKAIMDAYKEGCLGNLSSVYATYEQTYEIYYSESNFIDGVRRTIVKKIDGWTLIK